MTEVYKELVAIEQECANAFNSKNVNEIIKYFSGEISGFSSTRHERFHGKDDLRKTFEFYFSEADEVKYEIMNPEVAEFDDIAIITFYWKVTLKSGMKQTDIPGRASHVYRHRDGGWQIIHEHFSRAH
jgi:ketosteroid isomerase-like protein